MDYSVISALVQEHAKEARLQDGITVKTDAVSVTAYVIGFVDSDGKNHATKPDTPNRSGAATWYSLQLAILGLKNVPESNSVRRHPSDPTAIEMLCYVEANAEVKRYYWKEDEAKSTSAMDVEEEGDAGGEDAEEPKERAAAEPVKSAEKEEEDGKRKAFQKKDRSKMPMIWVTVRTGTTCKINVFNQKAITGIVAGQIVDVEGFGASVSVYMSKPNARYNPDAVPEPRVGFNMNTTGLTYLRSTNNPYNDFKHVPFMRWLGTEPDRMDVSFDVSRKGKPQDLRTIKNVELDMFTVIPYDSYVDFETPTGEKVHMESLPIEDVSDFAMDAKQQDGEKPTASDIEPVQKQYPVWRWRMLYVRYNQDLVEEIKSGQTKSYNLVCFTRMLDTIGTWGCPRAETMAQVMEVMPPLPSVAFCKYDHRNTEGNKYNQTRDPSAFCAGNIFFEVKAIASDLYGFLEKFAFHPSLDWFDKFFEHKKQGRFGIIRMGNRYPHMKSDPFHDKVVGASPSRPELWPIICLNNYDDQVDFLYPEDGKPRMWKLAILTSEYFSKEKKHTKKGQVDQARILAEIGKLSEEECDKCLQRESGAKYPVNPTSKMLIYAVRVYDDQRPVAVETI